MKITLNKVTQVNMNFGSGVKKIAASINVTWKFYKLTAGCKPSCSGALLDVFKNKNDPLLKEQLKSLSLYPNLNENIFLTFPRPDPIKKSIIEPDQSIKIKVELPLSNTRNKPVELPYHIEKDISEPPGQVIIKKAIRMIRIRRRKMKKHKKKKHLRKFKVQIETRQLRKQLIEENLLQKEMLNIIESSEKFSGENYVNSTLEKYNWVRPVTHVRGRLAPTWVIKKHLKDEEVRKMIRERFEECINARK